MSFRIAGLSPSLFSHLFFLPEADLAAHGARRCAVTTDTGFPERIEMQDAAVGQSVLLLNYIHQPADTPYRSSHAIYVREGANIRYESVDEIPAVMARRQISLRAFSHEHMLLTATLADGHSLAEPIEEFLALPDVGYLHAHYARYGCFAARIDRA